MADIKIPPFRLNANASSVDYSARRCDLGPAEAHHDQRQALFLPCRVTAGRGRARASRVARRPGRGPNKHPDTAGYAVIARAFLAADQR
jgi:hypothetical protein